MRKPKLPRLTVQKFGLITNADVSFGDLSIIVGPQATGKSLFLQTLTNAVQPYRRCCG